MCGLKRFTPSSQQTRDADPLLAQCWSSVSDPGPTLYQQWVNIPCLLGNSGKAPEACHCYIQSGFVIIVGSNSEVMIFLNMHH